MAAGNDSKLKFLTPEAAIEAVTTSASEKLDPVNDDESVIGDGLAETREIDIKRKQTFSGWTLWWLAYQSTGVIYGDIGTSPLYVYSSTFSSPPSYDDLLGALSLIIWALTLIVTVKYVCIVLCADDSGEGGTFAAYNLLARYCNIASPDPNDVKTVKMDRYLSTELRPSTRGVRSFIENSKFIHIILKVLAIFGVSLIMADGILTPAQSVLGAIQGLEVVKDDLSIHVIIGVSCAILVLLFLIQPLGISRISSAFAPIVMIWLVFNLAFGIYNLVHFDHSVLKAFSPYFAGLYFVRNKTDGWKSLGGILLAFTGVEALFADIGAFSPTAIRMSWLGLAYPCLLLAYIGQAAYISVNPNAYSNPFFKTVPPGMLYPSLVIAILAAIVASQAMITSTFQLLGQVINANYFPRIKMIYTSDKFHGQLYINWPNWLMMVGTVVVTAVYNNTTSLGNAYGTCVVLVTFITTMMIGLIALVVWKIHWLIVAAIWLPFITLDGLFLSSSLTKVPDGAWFTLLLAIILSTIFVLWRYGKEQQWNAEKRSRRDLAHFIVKNEKGKMCYSSNKGIRELNPISGMTIFFDKAGYGLPPVFEEFVSKFEALPEVQVFLHIKNLPRPYASSEDRYEVIKTSLPNCYRLVIRYGYNDNVVTTNLGDVVFKQIKQHILTAPLKPTPVAESNVEKGEEQLSARSSERLQILEDAYDSQIVYIVGKEQLRLVKHNHNIAKRFILSLFLWLRDNTRAKVTEMKIPIEKLVEVGFVREML